MEFEFSPHSASQGHINPQPSPESESNDIGTGFAMFSQYFGEFSSGSGPNQNLVSCFYIISSFCVTLFIQIIKECPLTQFDCGFVDFVSPYFHQFHIHSLHLGAKIHSHNFPYANLFQCVSDKFEERKGTWMFFFIHSQFLLYAYTIYNDFFCFCFSSIKIRISTNLYFD